MCDRKRCDRISLHDVEDLEPEGIMLTGTWAVWEAKMCVDVVNMYKGKIPILGVCLGHQILGYCAGAIVEKGKMPMHGKVTEIHTCGTGLFARLPESFHVTRYHSLVINGSSLPDDYQVDAISEDGAVMGISHRRLPLYGCSFTRKRYLRSMVMIYCIIFV